MLYSALSTSWSRPRDAPAATSSATSRDRASPGLQKGPANFVSLADKRAEEILYPDLAKARPGYGFIGEEGGNRAGDDASHTWIVDPLDGTTNFLHGILQFAISIGLPREDTIIAGVIYNPANEELYTADAARALSSTTSGFALPAAASSTNA